MNYAYSWGAAVVILGTLFKLTHLPGANLMLFIGMGTEVFVFFISAFDRPFDKTTDGMDLATDSQLEAEFAAAQSDEQQTGNVIVGGGSGGAIIIGGGMPAADSTGAGISFATGETAAVQPAEGAVVAEGAGATIVGGGVIGGGVIGGPTTPAPAVSQETAEAMEEATSTYVDRLNELNETLTKVAQLSERLSVDSEEMENLNRTLTGIARVYEMQLKSASQQITTQDEINEQTRKMAQQIVELNGIYTRMIEAMTTNQVIGARS